MNFNSSVPVAAGIVGSVGSVASFANVVANVACGPNSQASEASGLLWAKAKDFLNIREEDELKWGNSNGPTVNKAAYTAEMVDMVMRLTDANRDFGILDGSLSRGYGDSWRAPRHVHVYWAFGVPPHESVHTSFAFVYKSGHSNQDLYVMMKVDLQAIPHSARDNKKKRRGNADLAWKGGDIYILHEFKLVDGINRKVWKEKKGVYKMSMEDVIAVLHTVVNKTDPIYNMLSNNCIEFKNEVLEDTNLSSKLDSTEGIPNIPEKDKVEDTWLEGVGMIKVHLN